MYEISASDNSFLNENHSLILTKNVLVDNVHRAFMDNRYLSNSTGAFRVGLPTGYQLDTNITKFSLNEYDEPTDEFNFGAWNGYNFTLTE